MGVHSDRIYQCDSAKSCNEAAMLCVSRSALQRRVSGDAVTCHLNVVDLEMFLPVEIKLTRGSDGNTEVTEGKSTMVRLACCRRQPTYHI